MLEQIEKLLIQARGIIDRDDPYTKPECDIEDLKEILESLALTDSLTDKIIPKANTDISMYIANQVTDNNILSSVTFGKKTVLIDSYNHVLTFDVSEHTQFSVINYKGISNTLRGEGLTKEELLGVLHKDFSELLTYDNAISKKLERGELPDNYSISKAKLTAIRKLMLLEEYIQAGIIEV